MRLNVTDRLRGFVSPGPDTDGDSESAYPVAETTEEGEAGSDADVEDVDWVDEGAGPAHVDPSVPDRARQLRDRALPHMGRLVLAKGSGAGMSAAALVVWAWAWMTAMAIAATLVSSVYAAGRFGSESALGFGDVFVLVWQVFHLVPIVTETGAITLLPILPALILVVIISRSSRWLWASLRPSGSRVALAGVGALGGAYLVVSAMVIASPTPALAERGGAATRDLFAMAVLVLVAVLSGPLRERLTSGSGRWVNVVRSARVGVLALLGVAAALVGLSLWSSWDRVSAATDAILQAPAGDPTGGDAVSLFILQLLYVPNAVVWAASYVLGPGFSLGEGTTVSPFAVVPGTVPDLPMLAAVPQSAAPMPLLFPLLAVACGAVAGVVLGRSGVATRLRHRLVLSMVLAVPAAMAVGLLAAASSGGLGEGRLAHVGPDWVTTATACLLALGLGALLWAILPSIVGDLRPFIHEARLRWQRRRGKRTSEAVSATV